MAATVGVIGGIGPESTVDYYRALITDYRVLGAVSTGDLDGLPEYLRAELHRLAAAGADFALLASNTPHVVFDRLQQRSILPLISIVAAACRAALRMEVRRPALFGTRFIMESGVYDRVFSRAGVTVILPRDDERAWIHEKYLGELVPGEFRPDTRDAMMAIADRLHREEGTDGLILGGTELPLLLRGCERPGMPFIDTARVHVAEAVARLVNLQTSKERSA
jgi:aspartate racemase